MRGPIKAKRTHGHGSPLQANPAQTHLSKRLLGRARFFRSGRYRASVVDPANKLKFSTIIIAAIAGLVGFGVFLFIGALIATSSLAQPRWHDNDQTEKIEH